MIPNSKEVVKKRIASNLDADVNVLLELARGQHIKDKEWAIEQLSKMALAGVAIPSFSLT